MSETLAASSRRSGQRRQPQVEAAYNLVIHAPAMRRQRGAPRIATEALRSSLGIERRKCRQKWGKWFYGVVFRDILQRPRAQV